MSEPELTPETAAKLFGVNPEQQQADDQDQDADQSDEVQQLRKELAEAKRQLAGQESSEEAIGRRHAAMLFGASIRSPLQREADAQFLKIFHGLDVDPHA